MTYAENMPAGLQKFYDPEIHQQYRADTQVDVYKRLDAQQPVTRENVATHSLIRPHLYNSDEIDHSEALIMPYPFAIGLNAGMFMRSEYMANSLPNGRNVLAFTSRAIGFPFLPLSSEQKMRIAQGDFTPLTDGQCRAVEANGITNVDIFGYSQGAPVGLELAKQLTKIGVADVGIITSAEAPNSADRGKKELADDFSSPISDLNTAIQDTRIPAYIGFSNANIGAIHRIAQNISLIKYLAGAVLSPNIAVAKGFMHNTIDQQVEDAITGSDALVDYVRMQNSAILSQASFDATKERFEGQQNFNSFMVNGRGHEGGDQIVELAALAVRAQMLKR